MASREQCPDGAKLFPTPAGERGPRPPCSGHPRHQLRHVVAHTLTLWETECAQYQLTHGGEIPRCDELEHVGWAPEPLELLGTGSDRIVIGLCPEHVLKIDPYWWSSSTTEVSVWRHASPELRDLLCPVLQTGEWSKARWILAPRCRPVPAISRQRLNQLLTIRGLADHLWPANLGLLGDRVVVIDYGTQDGTERVHLGPVGPSPTDLGSVRIEGGGAGSASRHLPGGDAPLPRSHPRAQPRGLLGEGGNGLG